MFETCMVESAGQLRSKNSKWTTSSAFLLEAAMLSLVLLATMVRTERLPIKLPHVAPPYAPVRAVPIISATHEGGDGAPISSVRSDVPTVPTRIPNGVHPYKGTDNIGEPGPPLGPTMPGVPNGDVLSRTALVPHVDVQRPKSVRVSPGVQAASLIQQVKPVYPQIAIASHVEGAVVLHAMISRGGTVESLEVASGHPMLTQAALDAVRQWRYRPTYLGGDPVEVETTITVNFVLNK